MIKFYFDVMPNKAVNAIFSSSLLHQTGLTFRIPNGITISRDGESYLFSIKMQNVDFWEFYKRKITNLSTQLRLSWEFTTWNLHRVTLISKLVRNLCNFSLRSQ